MEPGTGSEARSAAYPCPNCGADTKFKPGSDALACEHCGHVAPIAAASAPIVEHAFDQALARMPRTVGALAPSGREVMCKGCGARTTTTQQASRCPFCDATMVVEVTTDEPVITPESVLPFHVERAAADGEFVRWLRGRWFAPFGMVKRAKRDGLDGVYLPYWTYDSATTTRYTGERGEHYWDTETYRDSSGNTQTRSVRKTRWWPASGSVDVSFDDVLVCATPSLPHKVIDKLEPWDLHDLRPFDGKYLAGFIAEHARIELTAGFPLAEAKMKPVIRSAICDDIGGDEQRVSSMDIRHDKVTFKHLLLPLWMSSFRYGDKVYRVIVNARTGEVAGERPWSALKIAMFIVVIAAVVIGIILLVKGNKH